MWRERIVCVGGKDKRRESGGETVQQYADSTTAGKLTPTDKMVPTL